MEATLNQNYIVDSYWALLKGLSDNIKLSLINKLSSSLLVKSTTNPAKRQMLSDFYGALDGTSFPSIEEIREEMQDEDKDIEIENWIIH